MTKPIHWVCDNCDGFGSVLTSGLTTVQVVYEVALNHHRKYPECGTFGKVRYVEDYQAEPQFARHLKKSEEEYKEWKAKRTG